MKARSAMPMSEPIASVAEGRLSTRVVRAPAGVIFDMREVKPPLKGPSGGGTWAHMPAVEVFPPAPASATYRLPSGPNFRPRGKFSPLTKGRMLAEGGDCAQTGAARQARKANGRSLLFMTVYSFCGMV